MKRTLTQLFSAALLLIAMAIQPAWAVSLDQAKASGQVGEQVDGYLGVVGNAGSDVKQLVSQINQKRRAAYLSGADNAGVELKVFEARMGQRLQQRTPAGQYIQQPDGRWLKK